MRRAPVVVAVAAMAAGCGTRTCKDGTLLLALSFDAASQAADGLSVEVATAGGSQTGASARGPMGSSGTLEVDFGSGYPGGASATVTVTATQGGAVVGVGSVSTTLSGKCARILIPVSGASVDMALGDDLSGIGPDLSMSGASPDMATCVPASASTTVWVDPMLGADDASHGALPGSCAYKTLTYALAHATGRINLLNTATYAAPGETLPFVLNGTQIVDGDPNQTGTRATLVGTGDFTNVAGTVIIRGTANQLLGCDVSSPTGTSANSIACIQVLTTGAHVIDSCVVHSCQSGSSIGISGLVSGGNSGGVTLTSTNFTAGILNCVNQIGPNWTIKNINCTCSNDSINGCGTGLTGCGNTLGCGPPCNGCTCPAGFTSACP